MRATPGPTRLNYKVESTNRTERANRAGAPRCPAAES